MKKGLLYVAFALSASCTNEIEQKPEPVYDCPQKMELLKATGGLPVKFDFGRSVEKEFEYFEEQTGVNTCNTFTMFSIDMPITDTTSVGLQVTTERYCVVDTTAYTIACFRPSSLVVLMNAQSKLLVEDEYCELDSVRFAISEGINSDMLGWNNRKVLISVLWDDGTPADFKRQVFHEAIQGYLMYADSYALENYGRTICSLDSSEVMQVKEELRLWFVIEDRFRGIPPPPPPLRY